MHARVAARASIDSAVALLVSSDVASLAIDAIHAEVRWLRRIRAQLDAIAASLLQRRREILRLGEVVGRGLVADTGISGSEARRLADTTRAIESLPSDAFEALARGEVSSEHLRALARGGAHLDGATTLGLIERAKTTTPDAFRRRVHEAALRADPDGSARQRRQRAARDTSLVEDDEGMIALHARVAADDGAIVRNALHRAVDELWRSEHHGQDAAVLDQPTFGARLADALVHICRRYLEPRDKAAKARPVPLLSLQVDLQTLRDGLHESSRHHTDWGQPLPVETLRRLACEAEVVPIVCGGGSVPLDMGRSRRYPTFSQRLAVIMRDRSCRFPGCDAPPAFCDVHHVVHWVKHGPTDLQNLVLLCTRHHHAVHEGGWSLTGNANGRLRVRPPDGWSPTARGAGDDVERDVSCAEVAELSPRAPGPSHRARPCADERRPA